MQIEAELARIFAPTGALRAVINVGNAVLAKAQGEGHDPSGVSVDLARAWADRLRVPLRLQVVKTAALSVSAVAQGDADIGFFAIDPARAQEIEFTSPYVVIEGNYLVRDNSPITDMAQVDREGSRVVVGRGTAYDLFLSRELKAAQIVRTASSQEVIDTFLSMGAEVAAGVRQQLEADARRQPGLRILPQRFMQIRQAMAAPRHFGPQAHAALAAFIDEMKNSGFVATSLARHGIDPALAATD